MCRLMSNQNELKLLHPGILFYRLPHKVKQTMRNRSETTGTKNVKIMKLELNLTTTTS